MRGDYLNVFVTFDLTLRRLGEIDVHHLVRLDPNMKHLNEVINPPDFLTGAMAEPVRPGRRSVQDPAGHGDPARRGTP